MSSSSATSAALSASASDLSRWFIEKVQPHEPELRLYLKRRFPAITDTDDVVQETYVRLLRAKHLGVVLDPRAYLFRTARNAAYDFFREKHQVAIEPLEDHSQAAVLEDRPDAAETVSHAQEIDMLAKAIESLPGRCRDVLTLRKLHGLSYREIARRLQIAESTVNTQLAIGMIRCRQFLEARGVLKGGKDGTERAPSR